MQIARGQTKHTEQAIPAASAGAKPATGTDLRRVIAGLSPTERTLYGLGALTALAMAVTVYQIFLVAPVDSTGDAFRVFYFHVPIASLCFVAFFVVFVASIVYLWKRDERWDWLARAAAETGTIFATLTLITGSIWGRTTWGTWWTWDPRLTTTLILWFIYAGYLMLRSYTGRTAAGARAAAVLGIIGFVDVPIDYLSVTWWRTIHPPTNFVASALPTSAGFPFMLSFLTFALLFAFLLILAYQLQRVQAGAERLREQLAADAE
jgi:heme exporter protein C